MNEAYDFLKSLDEIGVSAQSDMQLLYCFMYLKAIETGTSVEKMNAYFHKHGLPNDEIYNVISSSNFKQIYEKYALLHIENFSEYISELLPFQVPLYMEIIDVFIKNEIHSYRDSDICTITIAVNLFKKNYSCEGISLENWFDRNTQFGIFWKSSLNLQMTDFELLCFHSCLYPFEQIKVKSTGNLAKAKKKYQDNHAGYELLFNDYLDAKAITGEPHQPYTNLWKLSEEKKGINAKEGVSVNETLYNYSLRIAEMKPTDVIRSLFYSNDNNDSALECHYLLHTFFASVSDQKASIINPSPDTILLSQEYKNIQYIVPYKEFYNAYKSEFKYKKFYTPDWEDLSETDRALYFFRSSEKNNLEDIIQLLDKIDCKFAKILLPSSVFEKGKNNFVGNNSRYHITDILILDNNLTVTSPRKKVIVTLVRNDGSDPLIHIGKLHLSDSQYVGVDDSQAYVRSSDFAKAKTINSMVKQFETVGFGKEIDVKHRNRPSEYSFSKEIKLKYKYVNRKGQKTAAVAYHSYPINGKSRKISRDIEKGLKVTEGFDIEDKLEGIVFQDELRGIIEKDIRECFKKDLSQLSLKTYWFIEYDYICTDEKYNEDIARSIFSSGNFVMEEMVLRDVDVNILKDEVERITTGFTNQSRLQYWDIFNLLFKRALSKKYIMLNPISEIYQDIHHQISEEQKEVRNALTKKNLSIEEQKRLLTNVSDDWEASTDIDTLIVAFRLFTGISSREMTALTWKDFVKLSDYDCYQIQITHVSNNEGDKISYGQKEDWNKFRCVPIVKPLSQLLLKRKKELMGRYNMDESKIDDFPIFCRRYDKRNKHQEVIAPYKINEICRKAVNALQLEDQIIKLPGEKEVETNLSKYRADLFVSNFKYHANHTCLMTAGEINYVLGLAAPNTFSKHYCDYTNEAIQYMMANKLLRWVVLLMKQIQPIKRKRKSSTLVSGPYNQQSNMNLIFEINEPTTIEMNVSCEHGAKISVVFEEQESNDA